MAAAKEKRKHLKQHKWQETNRRGSRHNFQVCLVVETSRHYQGSPPNHLITSLLNTRGGNRGSILLTSLSRAMRKRVRSSNEIYILFG